MDPTIFPFPTTKNIQKPLLTSIDIFVNQYLIRFFTWNVMSLVDLPPVSLTADPLRHGRDIGADVSRCTLGELRSSLDTSVPSWRDIPLLIGVCLKMLG